MTWSIRSLFFMFLLFLPEFGYGQEDCEMVEDYQGIKIFECEMEGSNINSVKANFEIEATLSQYAYLVLNLDHYPAWNHEARNVKLVRRISKTELIYYTEVDAPWPLQDRDIILHLKVSQDPVTKVLNIHLTSRPAELPEYNKFIRIHDYWSLLQVTPISKTHSRVDYYLELDPGGDVPSWFVNLISSRIPRNTFVNFREGLKMFTDNNLSFSPIVNK